MNTQKQLFATGFVKRAMEYGLTEQESVELLKVAAARDEEKLRQLEELQSNKVNVPLQTFFAAGMPGLKALPLGLYNGVRDVMSSKDVPNRTLGITGSGILGGLGGALLGGGVGGVMGGDNLAHLGALLGLSGGSAVGAYTGARNYNQKIDDLIKQKGLENLLDKQAFMYNEPSGATTYAAKPPVKPRPPKPSRPSEADLNDRVPQPGSKGPGPTPPAGTPGYE